MQNPRILLVTALFTPSRLIGARRPERMAVQLTARGWRVTVLTRPPASMRPLDPGQEAPAGVEIVRAAAQEPSTWARGLVRSMRSRGAAASRPRPSRPEPPAASSRRGMLDGLLSGVEFPDPLWGWRRFAPGSVAGRPFDVVLATVPPYSPALVGRAVAERAGAAFVLDYRDPWTESPGVVAAPHMPPALRERHKRAEDRCLAATRLVIGATHAIVRLLEPRTASRVVFLPNAYEPSAADAPTPRGDGSLVYVGSLSYGRDLSPVLRALRASPRARLVYAGPHGSALKELAREAGVPDLVEDRGNVPHAEALALLKSGSAGIVVVSDGYGYTLPGKLFDVLSAGRPVLLLGPIDGEAASLVRERRLGWARAFEDTAGIEDAVRAALGGVVPEAAPLDEFSYRVTGDVLDRELRALVTECDRPSA